MLQAFVPKLLGRAHVTAYVTGNIGVGAAADLARRVQSLLSNQLKTRPPFPSQVQTLQVSAEFWSLREDHGFAPAGIPGDPKGFRRDPLGTQG